MPHNSLKFTSGVSQNETPALNETGVSVTQLVRLKPDTQGFTLLEKLGGWARYWASALSGTIRALWAWEDTNANKWVAAGCETNTGLGYATLNAFNAVEGTSGGSPTGVYTATETMDITPTYGVTANQVGISTLLPTPFYSTTFSAIAGSSVITVYDELLVGLSPAGTAGASDAVYIPIPVSVAGLILSGLYPIIQTGGQFFTMIATNVLGQPTPAFYTTSTLITVTGGSSTGSAITLNWATPNYIFPAGEIVEVRGILPANWNGYHLVASSTNTSVTWASALGGAYVSGGVLANNGVTPLLSIAASLPLSASFSVVTVLFPDHGLSVGSTFTVAVPTGVAGIVLSGNYIVTSVPNYFTFTFNAPPAASAATTYINAFTVIGGTATGSAVTLNFLGGGSTALQTVFTPSNGDTINVFGVSPTGWNGVYTVTGSTSSSVTYANASPAGSWVSGGQFSDNSVGPYEYMIYNLYASSFRIGAQSWTFDNWGQQLIACSTQFYPITGTPYQPIYYWDPTQFGTKAIVIPNGPAISAGALVAMPQRQIVAYGTTFTGVTDPLLIRWCDVNNYSVWIGQITNQAGSFRLATGSKIVGALVASQSLLFWTDIGLWTAQYVGPPYVYSFNQIGWGCGLIAQKAAGTFNGVTFWMSQSRFFTLTSEGVIPLVCPIWDVVFQDLDKGNTDNIIIAVNSTFQEVSWFYPQATNVGTPLAGVPTGYVKFNAMVGAINSMVAWDFGTLDRTAWIDQSVVGPPLGANGSNLIFQHEISPDADGAPLSWSFTTGYFALQEGDFKVFVDQFWPDMKWGTYAQEQAGTANATVNLTFNAVDYPSATPYTYGPYPLTIATTFITPRIRTRLLSLTFSGNDLGSFARIGNCRYRWQSDGRF